VGRFVGVGIESVAIGETPGSSVGDAIPALRAAVSRAVTELLADAA